MVTTKKTAAKKTATKRTAKKPTRIPTARQMRDMVHPLVRLPIEASQDLANRWPGGVTDNLPDDVRPAILAIEKIVSKSERPRQTIEALRVLLVATRKSELAAYVSELRLCSYRRGFIEGFVKYFHLMSKGGVK